MSSTALGIGTLLDAEIGGDHFRMRLALVRRALGDLAAEIEQFGGALAHLPLLLAKPGRPEQRGGDPAPRREVAADLDVLGDRHALEELHELKRADKAYRRDLVLRHARDIAAGERDAAGARGQEARDHAEERRLAG